MPGAKYVRADLHVHTFIGLGEVAPAVLPSVEAMLAKAREHSVAIIGITDHNSAANVRAAVGQSSPDLFVLPGIAKERRQVIVATHSANLAVLGDAELVLPLDPTGARSRVSDAGSVDNARTQEWVIRPLEGGRDAYRNRGERYGFRFQGI